MTILINKFSRLLTLAAAVLCVAASGAALASNGNGNGNANGGQSKGKAIGLVNRLNGNTIDYSSLEAGDIEEGEESDDDSTPAPGNSANKGKKGSGNNIGQGNASDGLKARIYTNKDIIYSGESLEIGIHFARGAELVYDGIADAFLVIFPPPAPIEPTPVETGTEEPAPAGEESPDAGGATMTPIILPLNQEVAEIVEAGDSTEEETTSEETSGEETPTETAALEPEVEEEEDDDDGKRRKLFEVSLVDTSEIPAGTYQLGLILTVPDGNPLDVGTWYNGLLGLVHFRGLTVTAEALPADADGDGMMDCEDDIEGITCAEPVDDGNGTEEGGDDSGEGQDDNSTDSSTPV